jgi:hypothetical protein
MFTLRLVLTPEIINAPGTATSGRDENKCGQLDALGSSIACLPLVFM